jgi:hypothetical protein
MWHSDVGVGREILDDGVVDVALVGGQGRVLNRLGVETLRVAELGQAGVSGQDPAHGGVADGLRGGEEDVAALVDAGVPGELGEQLALALVGVRRDQSEFAGLDAVGGLVERGDPELDAVDLPGRLTLGVEGEQPLPFVTEVSLG